MATLYAKNKTTGEFEKVGPVSSGTDVSTVETYINNHNTDISAHEDIREQINQLSNEKVDKMGITLDKDTDGLIYIFVNGKPVGNGVEVTGEIVEGDVTGVLDENNNLLLSGDIADGTYTLKWLKGDGTYVDAGNLIVSSITKYAINTTLSNCSASGATTINGGGSATVTITANSGYELPDTITVSGASHTWDKTTGNIVLSNPTSDVYITVTAEKAITNFAEYNADNTSDWSIWINNARVGSDGTYRSDTFNDSYGTPAVSNYVAVQNGDVIEFTGMYAANKSALLCDSNKTPLPSNGAGLLTNLTANLSNVSLDNGNYAGTFAINNASIAYVRIGGYVGHPNHPASDISIKIKRNGEYL